MILQSLCSYYNRVVETSNGSIPTEGFTSEKVHFALVINKSGKLVQIIDLREKSGKKNIPRNINVPQGIKKSVNIAANFLWGNTAYVLGADDKDKPLRTTKCHEEFKILHKKLLTGCNDEGAKAVLAFLLSWKPEDSVKLDYWQEMLKSNLVFQLDGELGFIHDRPAIKNIWTASLNSNKKSDKGMCLIDGKIAPIARLHPAIKGVRGSQSSGAALVSFNLDAFCSYGKNQNFNAPISELNAAAYSKSLNYLLLSKSNRIQIGDTTAVFWTERNSPVESFFGLILDPRDTAVSDNKELAVFLESVREGKLPANYEPDIPFYILGLSPNAARLSVRFWHVSTVKDISEKLGQHFQDLAMVKSFDSDPEYPGMWWLLKETANKRSQEGPPPLLAGAVMQSILKGTLYPQALLTAVIGRIRAEQNINYMKAAIIKAVLNRKYRILKKGMEVSMALDKENKNPAYLLGRLFAVLEKAQLDAIPSVNTTIKDKFYGSASATPRAVFPQLLRLSQYYVAKAEYGRFRDKQIEEIVYDIKEFPAHLNIDEQGLFAIGYYHQRQDIYRKSENKTNKEI